MFSIKKLLGHDEKFFDLLEASAEQADSSVHHLVGFWQAGTTRIAAEPRGIRPQPAQRKEITQELTEQLCKTFITPFEREDIQALAASLYKIPKTVEKIGERILICPGRLHGRSFKKPSGAARPGGGSRPGHGQGVAQGHRCRDRAREKCAPADDRRRSGQARAGDAARFIPRRLRRRSRSFSCATFTSCWRR